MTLPHRSVLVTGCSSGIGLATARLAKSKGWRVLATARKSQDIARLRDSDGLEVIPLELTDPASIARCADAALAATEGKLGALFNNAAYGQAGAIEDVRPEVMRRQLETNLIGPHDLARRLIPAMRRNGAGRIVQCSSVLGLVSGPFRGTYSASKFALEALSDAMRIELAGTGIHVSIIEPGPIRTRFIDNVIKSIEDDIDVDGSVHRELYSARLMALRNGGKSTFKLEPEAVAAKVLHALESPRPRIRYPVTVSTRLAMLMKRTLPDRIVDRIMKGQ